MPIPLNCILQSAIYRPQLSALPGNFLDIHIIKPQLDPTGFPSGSDSKESACNERPGFNPWVGKIPWRRACQPTPVFLPVESPWREMPHRLQSMGSQKSRTQQSD